MGPISNLFFFIFFKQDNVFYLINSYQQYRYVKRNQDPPKTAGLVLISYNWTIPFHIFHMNSYHTIQGKKERKKKKVPKLLLAWERQRVVVSCMVMVWWTQPWPTSGAQILSLPCISLQPSNYLPNDPIHVAYLISLLPFFDIGEVWINYTSDSIMTCSFY